MRKSTKSIIVIMLICILDLPLKSTQGSVTIELIKGRKYIFLHELISIDKIDSSFDIYTQKGRLYKKNHFAVYNVGMSVMLIDGRIYKTVYPVRRKKGMIMLPYDAGRSILKNFFPGIKFSKKEKNYILDVRG